MPSVAGRHHTLLERAWQSIQLVRRWLPGRELVFVADSSFAALEWFALVARVAGGSVHAPPARCGALCSPASACPAPDRSPPPQRETPADPGGGVGGREDAVEHADGGRLVWGRPTCGRGRHGHGGLVSHGQAACGSPLGADSRPARALQTASLVVDECGTYLRADAGLVCASLDDGSDL